MTRPVSRNHRQGAVTVEFALAAPVLFMFVFASIEFSRVNMIRNTIENAAYEGARRGVLSGATAANCAAVTQDLLDIIGVADSTITVTPLVILANTQDVTVTVEVPDDGQRIYNSDVLSGDNASRIDHFATRNGWGANGR